MFNFLLKSLGIYRLTSLEKRNFNYPVIPRLLAWEKFFYLEKTSQEILLSSVLFQCEHSMNFKSVFSSQGCPRLFTKKAY